MLREETRPKFWALYVEVVAQNATQSGYHVAAVLLTHALRTRQSCKKSNSVATLQHKTIDLCIWGKLRIENLKNEISQPGRPQRGLADIGVCR